MMNQRIIPYLAWGATIFGILLMVAGCVFAYLGRSVLVWGESTWQGRIIDTIPMVLILILGGLIAARLPGNPYGWVWLVFGFGFGSLRMIGQNYAIYALLVNTDLPYGWLAAALAGIGWFIGLTMLTWVFLLYPTGHLPGPRWRFLGWVIFTAMLIGLSIGWAMPESGMVPLENPYQARGSLAPIIKFLGEFAAASMFLLVLPCVFSLFLRFRNATGVVRTQLKWFAFGATVFCVVLASDFLITFPGIWENIKENMHISILPVVVGIAILRYHLLDIDLIIRKTLQYAVLTSLLALVYFGSVVLLQSLFESLTGQGSPIVIVISTLAIAALFNPLRLRVQRFIDRRFFRRKYNAEQTLANFSKLARDEVDVEVLTAAMLGVVEETMKPVNVSLWLKH